MRAFVMIAFSGLLAAHLALIPQARADDAPTTMLIVDGSGSMWGPIEPDRRAKIDIVRGLLKPLVQGAAETKIGLTSFGHRRKGDCSDVELVALPGPDRDLVVNTIDKLNPKGKGPIVEALRQSAKAIGATRPASILVVTDGADNCQQDACEAATEIARSQPGVAIHVVALAVDPDDVPRLSCVAKATGGKFYDVRDAQGIAAAIEEAGKLATLAPNASGPSSGPASGPSAATVPAMPDAAAGPGTTLRLTAALVSNSAIIATPLHWRVFKAGGKDLVHDTEAAALDLKLEAGNYDVIVNAGRVEARQSVTVETGKLTAVTVPLNAGRMSVRVKNQKDGEPSTTAVVAISATTAPKSGATPQSFVGHGGDGGVIFAPGAYTISVADGLAHQERQVTLAAGNEAAYDVILNAGKLEVMAATREDGEALEATSFSVAEDDPDSTDGRREVGRSNAVHASFTLTAGTYYVSARSGASVVQQRVAIGAGDVVKRTLVVPVGRLKVSSLISGQPAGERQGLIYRISSLDGELREITRSALPRLDLTLKAGKYRVAANLGAVNVKAQQDIALEAGKPADVVLKLDAGEISLKPPQGASAGPDVFWEIMDQAGHPVWHTSVYEPKALLAPGRYTVRMETKDKRTEAAFEIRSGDHKTVQLGSN